MSEHNLRQEEDLQTQLEEQTNRVHELEQEIERLRAAALSLIHI